MHARVPRKQNYFPLMTALSLHLVIMWQELVPEDMIYLGDELYREYRFAATVVRGRCSDLEKLDS